MDNTYWEAIKSLDWGKSLTILSAFGGAAFGQVCSHFLTKNRDTSKDKKEKFQNLYSPLAFKIVLYVKCEHGYHVLKLEKSCYKLRYPHPRKVFHEILGDLKTNIKYATPEIMSLYERLNRVAVLSMPFTDLEGEKKVHYEILERESFELTKSKEWEQDTNLRIEFCESFLNEYLIKSKQLNALSESIEEEINQALLTCKIYLLCRDIYLETLPEVFLQYSDQRKISLKTTIQLNKEIDCSRKKIKRLKEKNKKNNKKMQLSCLMPGFELLKNIMTENIGTEYIKSKLSEMLDSEKKDVEKLIIDMDSDGIRG
ncbi:hypothetical protein [Bacillus rhizoplanae]|uniref:hypothetical protein n=1 Tax=Bacillus rhizoplanae TaxID=2880966 RepID=UPI003D24E242